MGCNNGGCFISAAYQPNHGALAAPKAAGCACGGTCGGCSGAGHDHDHVEHASHDTAPAGIVAGVSSAYVPLLSARGTLSPCGGKNRPDLRKRPSGPLNAPQRPSTPTTNIIMVPRQPAPPPPAMQRGNVAQPRRPFMPPPPALKMPGGKQPSMPKQPMGQQPSKPSVPLVTKDTVLAPVPPAIIVTQAPMPTQLQPLPGRPYCADARLAGTELCAGAQVSDQCAATLANWLAANPGVPISAFLASSSAMGELCVDEFRRLLAPAGTKASGALPNYHRNSVYGFAPSGLVGDAGGAYTAAEQADAARLGLTGAGWTLGPAANLGPGGVGGVTYTDAMRIPAPSTPAVDYGALVAGIGGAVGATLGGVATIVNNAQQNRLRELQIEYANNAQGAQLALQRSALEMQAQIGQLAAQNTPAAQATVAALQQQLMATQAQLATQNSSAWSTGEILAATAVGVGVLALGGFLVLRK